MNSYEDQLKIASEYLSKHDKVLAPVIKEAGIAKLAPHTNYYSALVDSIIGQQLSVKAAATIAGRFRELFNGVLPNPELILEKSVEELRTVGLSNAKANYIRDLAQHVADGKLVFSRFDSLSNQEIVNELIDVKGIGEWTAHMFLIFCMGRLSVLATGDLGIRSGTRSLYKLADLPSPDKVQDIATKNMWHPYESVACWYVWRSLDNKPM